MFEKFNNYDSKQPTETRARCKITSVIWHDSVVRSGLIQPSHSSAWQVDEEGLCGKVGHRAPPLLIAQPQLPCVAHRRKVT